MVLTDSKAKEPVLTVAGQCHLSGISEPFLQALQDNLTIENPKYKDAKKYGRWVGKNFKQKLFFFELDEAGIFFPRGFAAQAVALCKKYMGRSPVIEDHRGKLDGQDQGLSADRVHRGRAGHDRLRRRNVRREN